MADNSTDDLRKADLPPNGCSHYGREWLPEYKEGTRFSLEWQRDGYAKHRLRQLVKQLLIR